MSVEPTHLTPAESNALRRRQRGRNLAMLVVLVALVALFYAISMVRFKTS
jgi:hypothetical protein